MPGATVKGPGSPTVAAAPAPARPKERTWEVDSLLASKEMWDERQQKDTEHFEVKWTNGERSWEPLTSFKDKKVVATWNHTRQSEKPQRTSSAPAPIR